MKNPTSYICDMCGKPRGRPYNHVKCSELRMATKKERGFKRGGGSVSNSKSAPSEKTISKIIEGANHE